MNAPPGPFEAPGLLIETSALVAILLREPEWREFTHALETKICKTCAFNLFEASLALVSRRGHSVSEAYAQVKSLVDEFAIEIVPLTPEMIPHAVAARERFGRGRKGLNMGDCLSYAATRQLGLKLLYKGDDFASTDVNA